MILGLFAALLIVLLPLIAAFCAGAAWLHFAKRANWTILSTTVGLLCILVPIVILGVLPHPFMTTLRELRNEFTYALWFVPGMIVLLNKYDEKGSRLGVTASLVYLSPVLLLGAALFWMSGSVAGLGLSSILAAIIVLSFRSNRLLIPARVLGVVLVLVPIAVPLAVRLPTHLAMAKACIAEAGTEMSVAPEPVSALAMELENTGCNLQCGELVAKQQVEAIETTGGGSGKNVSIYPTRLYRYELGPLVETNSRPPYLVEGAGICDRIVWLKEGKRCILANPIEEYSAQYVVRGHGDGRFVDALLPKLRTALTRWSFEIFDQGSGDVVAWTSAYFMPSSVLWSFYDVPLTLIMDTRGRCQENGPDLINFIRDFLQIPR